MACLAFRSAGGRKRLSRNFSTGSPSGACVSSIGVALQFGISLSKRLAGPRQQGLDGLGRIVGILGDLGDALLIEILGPQDRLVMFRQQGQGTSDSLALFTLFEHRFGRRYGRDLPIERLVQPAAPGVPAKVV